MRLHGKFLEAAEHMMANLALLLVERRSSALFLLQCLENLLEKCLATTVRSSFLLFAHLFFCLLLIVGPFFISFVCSSILLFAPHLFFCLLEKIPEEVQRAALSSTTGDDAESMTEYVYSSFLLLLFSFFVDSSCLFIYLLLVFS